PACVVPAGTVTPFTPPHVRVPPAIAHVPAHPVPWLAIVQFRPVFVGSGSLRLTPYASPVPLLYTVTVKPIGSPALTCAASAVFTMWISAGLHVSWALAGGGFESEDVSVAGLLYVPHSVAGVEVVVVTG